MTLDVIDDQGDATKSVSLLRTWLSGSSPPDAVFAGSTSNETLAMLPALTAKKIFNVGSSASTKIDQPSVYPYSFRPQPRIDQFGAFFGKAMKAKGYSTVGTLTTSDLLGQTSANAFKAGLTAVGIKVVAETYASTDLDLTTPMSRLAAAKPDAVIFSALAQTSPPLVLQARHKTGLTAPIYADLSVNADLYNLVPKSDVGNVFVATNKLNTYPKDGSPKAVADFVSSIKSYGKMTSYMINYSYGYDAVRLIQVAAKLANSTDASAMAKALESMTSPPPGMQLSYGNTKFSSSSHFNQGATDADYTIVPLGPLVDGQFRTP
jgi:branched-chain amino acid transport system substrate-binding protein